MKYPDADDHPDAAEAARERYDTLGAIGKEAAPEAIEAQLDDVMDVDGYLSWLAFNTLVRNGGTLLISPEGAEGGESDVSVCCVLRGRLGWFHPYPESQSNTWWRRFVRRGVLLRQPRPGRQMLLALHGVGHGALPSLFVFGNRRELRTSGQAVTQACAPRSSERLPMRTETKERKMRCGAKREPVLESRLLLQAAFLSDSKIRGDLELRELSGGWGWGWARTAPRRTI